MSVKTVFTALADQVRRLSGRTEQLGVEDMTEALTNVTAGIDTSDATAAATDMAKNKTAYVNGVKVTGSVDEVTGQWTGTVSGRAAVNGKLYLDGGFTKNLLFRKNSYVQFGDNLTNYGDAAVEDVVAGKTFTSTAGLKKVGTHVCEGSSVEMTTGEVSTGASAFTIHYTNETGYHKDNDWQARFTCFKNSLVFVENASCGNSMTGAEIVYAHTYEVYDPFIDGYETYTDMLIRLKDDEFRIYV